MRFYQCPITGVALDLDHLLAVELCDFFSIKLTFAFGTEKVVEVPWRGGELSEELSARRKVAYDNLIEAWKEVR